MKDDKQRLWGVICGILLLLSLLLILFQVMIGLPMLLISLILSGLVEARSKDNDQGLWGVICGIFTLLFMWVIYPYAVPQEGPRGEPIPLPIPLLILLIPLVLLVVLKTKSELKKSGSNMKSAWQCFTRAFSFRKFYVVSGRSSRAEFWLLARSIGIVAICIDILVVILTIVAGIATYDADYYATLNIISEEEFTIFSVVLDKAMTAFLYSALITFACCLILIITAGIRRMHDCGKSGGYFFIPFYGWFVLTSTKGMSGSNQYGPDPLQPTKQPICETCGKELQAGWKTCPYCQASTVTVCKTCGKELQADWKICPYCQTSTVTQP